MDEIGQLGSQRERSWRFSLSVLQSVSPSGFPSTTYSVRPAFQLRFGLEVGAVLVERLANRRTERLSCELRNLSCCKVHHDLGSFRREGRFKQNRD